MTVTVTPAGKREFADRKRVTDLSRGLGADLLFGQKFIPVDLQGEHLSVWAMREDADFRLAIAALVKKASIEVVEVLPEQELLDLLHDIFGKNSAAFMGMTPEVEKTVLDLLNTIIEEALRVHATDIHFQYLYNEESVLVGEVLFRIDRSLLEILKYRCTADELAAMMNVLGSRAKANEDDPLATKSFPHSGAAQRSVDLRVQFLEDKHGRTAVIRLVGNAMRLYKLDQLNMLTGAVNELKRQIQGPAGLHLLIGPQGVGKTTTLAAIIQFKIDLMASRGERCKIITAEDPIDIRLNKVTQIEVKELRGMSYAETAQSFTKADPDLVGIGEINDHPSLQAVIYATMLGRPCVGSIHAQNALSTFERLRLLGAEIGTLETILRTLLAQRMLRRLCPECKNKRIITADEKKMFELWEFDKTFEKDIPRQVCDLGEPARRLACTTCDGRGYYGVFPVFELVVVTPALIDAVKNKATISELEQIAIDQRRDFLPMSLFALAAADGGHVSLTDAREAIFER